MGVWRRGQSRSKMTGCCEHHSEDVGIPHHPLIHAFLSTSYIPGPAPLLPRTHSSTALAEPEGWELGVVGVSVWVPLAERNRTII